MKSCKYLISGLALAVGGCSPSGAAVIRPGDGVAATGGMTSSGTGGDSTNSGSTINNVGGMATGGASDTSTTVSGGGAFSTGGAPNAGGIVSTGGLFATGGKSSTGGTPSTGGKSSTGGTPSTGGKSSTGGTTSTGDMTATGGSNSTCTPSSTQFSFFITSRARLFALASAFNGSTKGFGGDFRYGESDGLAGADKICTEIAEASMPGNCKEWKAFLSTSTTSAVSRVGAGPWYDRLGRVVTNDTTGLLSDRPAGANNTIINNLPNEDGVLHHLEETNSSGSAADNHDILTGSGAKGTLYSSSANCSDWTSSAADTTKKPRVGHSWTAQSGTNWISSLDESGCAPGYNLVESGGPGRDGTVGSGGGYGAFYCFATSP